MAANPPAEDSPSQDGRRARRPGETDLDDSAGERDTFPFLAELASMGLGGPEEAAVPPEMTDRLPGSDERASGRTAGSSGAGGVPTGRHLPPSPRRGSRSRRPRVDLGRVRARVGEHLIRSLVEPSLAADVRRDRELAQGLRTVGPGCWRIVVLGTAPGAGQSTVAALVALTLSKVRDDRVAGVDLTRGDSGLAGRLGRLDAPTLDEVATSGRRSLLGQAVRWGGRGRGRTSDGPEVVRAGTGPDEGAEDSRTGTEVAALALLTLERTVAVTVVDLGPAAPESLLRAVLAGAHALVLVTPDPTSRASAQALRSRLREQGFGALTRGAVVVTRATPRSERSGVRGGRDDNGAPSVPLPEDPALASSEPLDLAATRTETRRAATRLALAVVAGHGGSITRWAAGPLPAVSRARRRRA